MFLHDIVEPYIVDENHDGIGEAVESDGYTEIIDVNAVTEAGQSGKKISEGRIFF